jgi:hypothetical protein
MSVSHGGVDVSVAHDRSDSGECNAGMRRSCTERMPEILRPESFNVCLAARGIEGGLHVSYIRSLLSPRKEKLILRGLPKLQQLFPDPSVHRDETISMTLSMGGLDFIRMKIDMLPFEPKDLTPPHTRVQRQHNDGT